MTNENPDNSAPDSADVTSGQHDFATSLSSESAAPEAPAEVPAAAEAPAAPETPAAPAAPAVSEPVAAAEAVVPPAPVEPVVPPASEPAAAYSATPAAPGYPGAAPHDPTDAYAQQPAGAYAQQPADAYGANAYPGAQQGGYQANGYPVGAYSAPAPAPKKPMSKGLLFGLIGGGVALVLIIAAVIVVPMMLRGPSQTASGVVEEYLTAISEGDAEAALEFIDTYADDSLLTDEVLAASLELAPITDIVVEESEAVEDYARTEVSASFSIGGETVEREFEVYKSANDWVLYDGVVTTMLSNFEGLGLTVNGAEPGDESVALFPGTYQLALGYEQFAIDSDVDTFTVVEDDDGEDFWDLYPVLTDEGAETFRSLVRAAVEECVAMKTLTTPCGMDLTDIDLQGYTPVDGTVTRTITAEGQKDLDGMEPEADYSTPTLVSTYDSVDVDMTIQGKKDGQTAEFDVWFGGYMNSPSVDFAEENPTVTWE
ncbi:hypothetical protein [Microbacterium sp.]|uniref:hypothetical protein n=1 Tax=Microbacterium sp. TaxID=51671 RepID=UPI002628BDFC|nr:hypothetical protein [Microbacterium sp.]